MPDIALESRWLPLWPAVAEWAAAAPLYPGGPFRRGVRGTIAWYQHSGELVREPAAGLDIALNPGHLVRRRTVAR